MNPSNYHVLCILTSNVLSHTLSQTMMSSTVNNPPPLQHAPGLPPQLPPPLHPGPASPLSYPRVFEVGKES